MRVTSHAPHIRDVANLRRIMSCVVLALAPPFIMAVFNTGYQANVALAKLGISSAQGWRGDVLNMLGVGVDPSSIWASMSHGVLYVLPLVATTAITGCLWELTFATIRKRPVTEGFLVTAALYALILPPAAPLWQVALGLSFGVVLGKEIFGGTGKNFLNPALLALAFVHFAYPDAMAGNPVWVHIAGYGGTTVFSLAAAGGMEAVVNAGITWKQAFLGTMQGMTGTTSALASLLGAAVLLHARIASWRVIGGIFIGVTVTALLFGHVGDAPIFEVPWYWHLTLGGVAFGAVFMATDPVTSASTDPGRWIYGLLIGFTIVLIRIANPAHPDGVMLAILLGNVFAPLIDYLVIRANIRRRERRNV